MKKLLIVGFLLMGNLSLSAQERPINVQITDLKGRTCREATIYLQSTYGVKNMNKAGGVRLMVQPQDTLYVLFKNQIRTIPVNTQTDILVRIDTKSAHSTSDPSDARSANTAIYATRFSANDFNQSNLGMFRDLASLITSRYPLLNPSGALVILDGQQMQSFEQVNRSISVLEIKNIEWGDQILYGVDNSLVLIITTKSKP